MQDKGIRIYLLIFVTSAPNCYDANDDADEDDAYDEAKYGHEDGSDDVADE